MEGDSNKLTAVAASLRTQDEELTELRADLKKTKASFESFQNDYSSLLTLYNETNDQLQELLRVRQAEPSAQPNNDGVTKRCEVLEKRCDVLEKERDRYKELYENNRTFVTEPAHDDQSELQDQVQYLAQQVEELSEHREVLVGKVAETSARNDQLMQELAYMAVSQEQGDKERLEHHSILDTVQQQLDLKNSVIDNLKEEFTKLGEDKERLEAVITRTEESKVNQLHMLDTANVNKDDLTKEFQVLQYRCSETERREQEAVTYIKNCLQLVEQTQHEKEQLIIQCKQSEMLRLETEETLSSLIEEASRRTLEEVGSIRKESNKKLSALLKESAHYQEVIAVLESDLENITRERDTLISQQDSKVDAVLLADKEAVIFKLKDHIFRVEQDRVNLTDQLMEVTSAMKLSKEHFESKIGSATSQLTSFQDKVKVLVCDNSSLYQELGSHDVELEQCRGREKGLRSKINELTSKLSQTQTQLEVELAEVREGEERKKEVLKEGLEKTVAHLREALKDKQQEMLQQQEVNSSSLHSVNTKETDYINTIKQLNKKLSDMTAKQKQHKQQLINSTELYKGECEGRSKLEARLRAVNMQLNSANNQIAMVTENEAKLCSVQKELQLKLDMMTFDLQRKGGSDTSVLGLNTFIVPPSATKAKTVSKDYKSRDKKSERREKEEINKIFSSYIRSEKKDKEKKKRREKRATSTPITDKSDVTVKYNEGTKEFMTETDTEGDASDVSFR